MTATARMVVERRAVERFVTDIGSTLGEAHRKEFDVVIENLSVTGFSMAAVSRLPSGESIVLDIPGLGIRSAVVVRNAGGSVGCEFACPLTDEELLSVLDPWTATIIPFPVKSGAVAEPEFAEPSVAPFARWQRGLLLIGLGAASWSLVIWAGLSLLAVR
jgi:hypothetical protein